MYTDSPERDITAFGRLHQCNRPESAARTASAIDALFFSFVAGSGDRAIGGVFCTARFRWNAGSPAIKADGGITFEQDRKMPTFDGMPANAIAAAVSTSFFLQTVFRHGIGGNQRYPYVGCTNGRRPPVCRRWTGEWCGFSSSG